MCEKREIERGKHTHGGKTESLIYLPESILYIVYIDFYTNFSKQWESLTEIDNWNWEMQIFMRLQIYQCDGQNQTKAKKTNLTYV